MDAATSQVKMLAQIEQARQERRIDMLWLQETLNGIHAGPLVQETRDARPQRGEREVQSTSGPR